MAGQELVFGGAKNINDRVTNTNSIKQFRWQDGLLWVGAAPFGAAGMIEIAAV